MGPMGYVSFMEMYMNMGGCNVPKESKSSPKGEDSYFICEQKQTFGVADGVGGWILKGVDSGIYARKLMKNSLFALSCIEGNRAVNPKEVLEHAYWITDVEGSSTACIITLKDEYLHAVNVGDSGFLVFRDNKLIYQSPIQQYAFNHPYQLGNGKSSDTPDMGQELSVKVEFGDIIIAGTDGLLDNIFPSEIEEILSRQEPDTHPEMLSSTIAGYALYNSFDRYSDSPFARAAKMAGYKHRGGKIDDITVIVAKIQ